jgi:hypothetical protein
MAAEDIALEPRWYAVRTRSRHEKQVHAQLTDRPGIDCFPATASLVSATRIGCAFSRRSAW